MDIPPRTATDLYLSRRGERLDIVFDVDLGELIEGHHVVARGIMLGRPVPVRRLDPDRARALLNGAGKSGNGGGFLSPAAPGGPLPEDPVPTDPVLTDPVLTEPDLHYEFVPGLTPARSPGPGAPGWYWTLSAADDVGTQYSDSNGGAFDGSSGGAATHGTRDIGAQIPPQARRLTIRFRPAEGWTPPGRWRREILIDLHEQRLLD